MAIATFTLVVGAFALSACGNKGPVTTDPATPTPTAVVTTTPTAPTTPATISTAADLVGDWQDVKAQWAVHFKDDGTYVEDFQGIMGFRVGTYDVTAPAVSLIGSDGNTDKGAISGTSLTFKLGTLTRK